MKADGMDDINLIHIDTFTKHLDDIEEKIRSKNINENLELKLSLQQSRQSLVDMMDESYQEAFNLEIRKTEK